jgi:hypothetical protein
MALRIKIEIVGAGRLKTLAAAEICNVSDLAKVSNYKVRAFEDVNPVAGNAAWIGDTYIDGHARDQSVWRLVEKAAKWAADQIDTRYMPKVEP